MPTPVVNQQGYVALIEAVVRDKMRSFGPLAVRKLHGIVGLRLDDGGTILELGRDPVEVLHEVVVCFEKLAGKASVVFAKKAIQPVLAKYPGLTLPVELR